MYVTVTVHIIYMASPRHPRGRGPGGGRAGAVLPDSASQNYIIISIISIIIIIIITIMIIIIMIIIIMFITIHYLV